MDEKGYTIVVTGDRNWSDWYAVEEVLNEIHKTHGPNVTLIHGGCRGLDLIAGEIGKKLQWNVIQVDADWKRYHGGAGPKRNKQMLEMKPDFVHGFHNDINRSRGTKDCLSQAQKMGLPWKLHNS